MLLPFSMRHIITNREMKMAVNSEVRIPRPRVVANPRIGPEPKKYRITAVTNVVTLESMMAESAPELE